MTPEIIYFDNHLLIANKPSGMTTQPNGIAPTSLEDFCKNWVKEKYEKPGNIFLHALHRLDKPASGLVLFAKTSKALSRLNASMRAKTPLKTYLTIIEGHLPSLHGTLEHYLVHGDHQAEISSKTNPNAKFARLHYATLKKTDRHSFLEVTLETGRYHQIRAQMAAMGTPIVGDARYGSSEKLAVEAISLQHYRFQFSHPITQEVLTFSAPKPLFPWSLKS